MLFLNDIKDYKTLASGLRREMGLELSHNQVLEALAKALGHKSFAALKAAQPTGSLEKAAAATTPAAVPAKAPNPNGWPEDMALHLEHAFCLVLADRPYQLLNDGRLDLVARGESAGFVTGLHLTELSGTVEDILCCTGEVSSVERDAKGDIDINWGGSTDVNWDGQTTRVDGRGKSLWYTHNGDFVSEDACVAVPEGFSSEDMLDDDAVVDWELPVRDVLVQAVARYLRSELLVELALTELTDDDSIAQACEDLSDKATSALGRAQNAVGFQMHVDELHALEDLLSKD